MENLNTSTNGVTPKAKPRSLVCYICGREFGTKSLKIHLKTCAQKWEWEESKKPKKDQRPVPQAPLDLDELLQKETIEWEQIAIYNTQASETFNNEGLVKCEFCNRTFFDQRMVGHKKICNKERPLNPLREKFQTTTDFKEKNRCKSTPRYHEAEDVEFEREKEEKKNVMKLKRIKEIQCRKQDSIIYEAQSEDLEDNHMKVTDSFVIPSPKAELTENKQPSAIPLDRKYTESFVKKVRMEKKRGSKQETGGSPKMRAWNQADSKNNESKNNLESKNGDSPNQKGKNTQNPIEMKKTDSNEKKEAENVEGRPKNKTVMKATESFLKKMSTDRKKSDVVLNNYSKKSEGKRESWGNNEEDFEMENKKKDKIKEEQSDDIAKYARRKYKIYTPLKTFDFNY